jgi:hypothetical protein
LRQPALAFDPVGQAEVDDVRLPFGIDQNVLRLQVKVEDASSVDIFDGLAGVPDQFGRLSDGEWSLIQ